SPRFLWKLGRDPSHILEVPDHAVSLAALRQSVDELESHREVRRCDCQHIPQSVFVPAGGCAIALLCLQLSERVQHARIARRILAELFQRRTRFRRAIGKRIKLCQRQSYLAAGRVELSRPQQLSLSILVAASL